MKAAVADGVAWLRYAVVGCLSLTDAVLVNSAADLPIPRTHLARGGGSPALSMH